MGGCLWLGWGLRCCCPGLGVLGVCPPADHCFLSPIENELVMAIFWQTGTVSQLPSRRQSWISALSKPTALLTPSRFSALFFPSPFLLFPSSSDRSKPPSGSAASCAGTGPGSSTEAHTAAVPPPRASPAAAAGPGLPAPFVLQGWK